MDDFAHIVGEDVHFRSRSPPGERGLKLIRRPVRLVWNVRRSPPGERGLKFAVRGGLRLFRGSLPTRGAWIEITPEN